MRYRAGGDPEVRRPQGDALREGVVQRDLAPGSIDGVVPPQGWGLGIGRLLLRRRRVAAGYRPPIMDRPGKFQKLAAHDQIDAACIASTRDGTVRVEATRGAEHWGRVFPHVITMMKMANEPAARAVFKSQTVVVESDGDRVIAVAFKTGTAVSKSVRRMIRQAFGKPRRDNRPSRTPTQDALPAMPSPTPATSPVDPPAPSPAPPPKAFG